MESLQGSTRSSMTKRCIYMDGGGTSIKLEPIFWDIIEEIAAKQGVKWQQWARSILLERDNVNKASTLRVAVVAELCLQLDNVT